MKRVIPSTAYAALVAMIVKTAIAIAVAKYDVSSMENIKWLARGELANAALGLLVLGLLFAAALDVLRASVGVAAIGARIAAAGFGAALVLDVVVRFFVIDKLRPGESFYDVLPYLWTLATVAGLVGLALSQRVRALVAVAVVVAIASDPPGTLGKRLYETLGISGLTTGAIVFAVGQLVATILAFALLAAAQLPAPDPDAPRARSAFQLCASSMWLRVLAATSVFAVLLLLVAAKAKDGLPLVRLATVVAAAADVASLAMFAAGAIGIARSAFYGVPRAAMVVAGCLVGFVAAIAVIHFPHTLDQMYFARRDFEIGGDAREALSIAGPIVGLVGMALAIAALAAFASRHESVTLSSRATTTCIIFVGLTLASLGIQFKLLPDVTSASEFAFYCLLVIACGLISLVMTGKAFAQAAAELAEAPAPPPRAVAL